MSNAVEEFPFNSMRYREAVEEFDGFAGMGSPDLPDDEISAAQVALYRWQIKNFGTQPMERMVLGILEESGELASSYSSEGIEDAIGDICVFSSQACTSTRLGFKYALIDANIYRNQLTYNQDPDIFRVGLIVNGKVSHRVLKRLQGIRGMGDKEKFRQMFYCNIVNILGWASTFSDKKIQDIFLNVSRSVMERDWAKDPNSGNI